MTVGQAGRRHRVDAAVRPVGAAMRRAGVAVRPALGVRALLSAGLLLASAVPSAAGLLDFSAAERQQIQRHGPWPPAPARDAGNAHAGRPAAIALGKATAHWLTTGLPLLLAAVPMAIMLRLPDEALPALLLGLVPGTAFLSLIGTAGAALVLGARRGGVLLPLLVLPMAVPALIFGVAAADAAAVGLAARPHLLLLSALCAAALPLCPLAAGAALRSAAE